MLGDQSTSALVDMILDYQWAVERFQNAIEASAPRLAVRSIFEALNWATSIDERIAKQWAPRGDVLGFDWRAQIEGAEIMAGVGFARNRAHHQWANAIVLEVAPESSIWRWCATHNLPPADARHPDRRGEQIYRDMLGGRPVRPELDVLEGR